MSRRQLAYLVIAIVILGMGFGLGRMGARAPEELGALESGSIAESPQVWTCSMHPQIMQPEPGDCPICGMDLILAEVGADGLPADQFKLTENAIALANIQTTIVGNGKADNNMTF